MEIIKACNDYYLNQTESTIQRNESSQIQTKKKSKVLDYFSSIYAYPKKIKIKWDAIDELNEDLFIDRNYGVLQHSVPFIDFIESWFFKETADEATSNSYLASNYSDGFLDKINSSNFFFKNTKQIQNSLANIPVFAILNGQGEIVLSKPSNVLGSKTITTSINEKIYDSCGSFDPLIEKKSELGLFFMDKLDAEKYLQEIALSDIEGTQTVGLSIHCINLSSAYKITREYHPGIDFRFVPNFNEVKTLLVNNIGKSDMIVEDEQQQLRFRRRTVNLFPYLKKLGTYLSPSSSFLQRNEYYKGVPLYVVQLADTPRNFWVEQYFNVAGTFDSMYSRCIEYLDHTIGFGHNWIMQGSLKENKRSGNFDNYIFFEKKQALKFAKLNGRKIARYNGGRTSNLEFMVKKPKIFVYNLEDFIEEWEDNLLGKINNNDYDPTALFKSKNNHFISPNAVSDEIKNISENYKKTNLKGLSQSLNVKFRVLKRTVGILFSLDS